MKKYKEQQAVLKQMQDDLTRMRREIDKTKIGDPTPNLKKIEAEIKAVKTEKDELKAKIEALSAEKEEKVKAFEKYKKDYPLRSK